MYPFHKEKILVTGAAGFIGSHLIERLVRIGVNVVGFDNLSSGRLSNVEPYFDNPNFHFIKGDLLDSNTIKRAIKDTTLIFHLAANPEVRVGYEDTSIDLKQNVICTHNLLELMRNLRTPKAIVFSSTSTVYGDATILPTPESYGPLIPISNYGASKLACEAFISSYCHLFEMQGIIFRFANVVGQRGHGVIKDFIDRLSKNPKELQILGDGTQTKSYLFIDDCIDAFLFGLRNLSSTVNIFNIGSEDQISVKKIADIVIKEMDLNGVKKVFTGGENGRGWHGDVKNMYLSIEKLRNLGWKPKHNSEESVRLATQDLLKAV